MHAFVSDFNNLVFAGARHPLLMARSLPPLPALTEQDDSEFDSEFQGQVAPLSLNGLESDDTDSRNEEQDTPKSRELPQPIDLLVPPGKTSVVLTGPNTGEALAFLQCA